MASTPGLQNAADGLLAGTAVSSPFWIEAVGSGLHIYLVGGGAVLVTLRIISAIRDFTRKE